MAINKKPFCISDHPILSRVWASDLNGNEDPSQRGCKSNNMFKWICIECKESFSAWPKTVIYRDGRCEKCYKRINVIKHTNSIIKRNGSIADVPEIMAIWHNNNPDPHTICKSSERIVQIYCADCKKIVCRKVKNIYHFKQYYCNTCAEKRRRESYRRIRIEKHETCEVYPEIMAIWDWDKNLKRPEEVPAGSDQTIFLKCPICGHTWKGKPYARKNNHSCCGRCARIQGFKLRTQNYIQERGSFGDKYPHLVQWWHPTKNGNVSPFDICINDKEERYFKCNKGHVFKAKPCDLGIKRTKCPKCKPGIHTSFMEKTVAFYLSKVTKVQTSVKVEGSNFIIDILLPELKTCVEYDGVNWHNNESAWKRDLRKDALLESKGLRLIRIQEWKSDSQNVSTIFYDYNKGDCQVCMNSLCDMLFLPHVDVDLVRDTPSIYKLLYPEVLENSISAITPQLVRYWDKSANNGIEADKVAANSHLDFNWKCPECGDKWSVSPAYMKRRTYPCKECGLKIRGRKSLKEKVSYLSKNKGL